MIKPNYMPAWFLQQFIFNVSGIVYNKIIASKILSQHPYNKLNGLINTIPYELLDKLFTPYEIIEYFSEYFVNNIENADDVLIVDEY